MPGTCAPPPQPAPCVTLVSPSDATLPHFPPPSTIAARRHERIPPPPRSRVRPTARRPSRSPRRGRAAIYAGRMTTTGTLRRATTGRPSLLALLGAALAGCTHHADGAVLDTATAPRRRRRPRRPDAEPDTDADTRPRRPTPTPELLSPLTGMPIEEPRPVLVVKLDNTQYAQPHAGLDKADLVYLEEVEYGITRLAAVFSSHLPKRIGPVRSARITDIDLLAQYDRPAFGFSGAQRKMLPVLAAAPFYRHLPRHGGRGLQPRLQQAGAVQLLPRRPGRASPARRRPPSPTTWASSSPPNAPSGGLVASTAHRWPGATPRPPSGTSPATGPYAVSLNGQRARSEAGDNGQNAATVVIQYVKQTPSAYFDKGGGNTPHAADDRVRQGPRPARRPRLDDDLEPPDRRGRHHATRWPTARPMPFKPGQSWIVLLDKGVGPRCKPLTEPAAADAGPWPPRPHRRHSGRAAPRP